MTPICEQCPRDKESRFDASSEELLLNKPSTLEDSLHRASKYMEMEEEKKAFAEKTCDDKQRRRGGLKQTEIHKIGAVRSANEV
ncbi:hypothetical protein F2Q68_00008387 [Brassica cretica]|uniref:Uncharacterized protein n=1 Tax=Brassica cretica TaxID=69181 RepID=A0A8S9KZH6_BRACR|nr:hypothetical protein F2Q68_00008387 [Brassica cretica]